MITLHYISLHYSVLVNQIASFALILVIVIIVPGYLLVMFIFLVVNMIVFSFSICHRDSNPGQDLEEILRDLRTARVTAEGRTIVNVRRRHIWEDSCRCLQRKRFSPSASISVCFADDFGNSEGAVDIGGPRREFLRLLVKAANEHSGIFGGPADRRVLVPNSNGNLLHLLCRSTASMIWPTHVRSV